MATFRTLVHRSVCPFGLSGPRIMRLLRFDEAGVTVVLEWAEIAPPDVPGDGEISHGQRDSR